MVEFITLFFGISLGILPVELSVTGPVEVVEIQMDGRVLGTVQGPPWKFHCDFGRDLRPHELVAIAFDKDGKEIDRERQWINYSGKSQEAALALEGGSDGAPKRGRVVWRSALERRPTNIAVAFDGQSLEVDREGHFELPSYDFEAPHHLQAEVEFRELEAARAEAIFGGAFGEEVTTALTAIPVLVPDGQELPKASEMEGWLEVAGQPTSIFSTQTSGGSVVMVRDHSVRRDLEHLKDKMLEKKYVKAGKILSDGRKAAFVLASPLPGDPTGAFRAFPASPKDNKAGLWSLLAHRYPRVGGPSKQRLWQALALAAIKSANSQEPRAVVLVLSSRPKDWSPVTFDQAKGFLRHMRVPLFVWAPKERTFERLEIQPPEATYYGAEGMLNLFRDVDVSLAQQRMLWLEDEVLPNTVELTPKAQSVRLAF